MKQHARKANVGKQRRKRRSKVNEAITAHEELRRQMRPRRDSSRDLRKVRGTAPDSPWVTLRFEDGLVINFTSCPSNIPLRSHWRDNGSCQCEED